MVVASQKSMDYQPFYKYHDVYGYLDEKWWKLRT
jgi:hypothetical protein